MGQTGSVTACGNTVYKEDGNDIEPKHPQSIESDDENIHTPSNKRRIQYREREENKDNVSFIKYNEKKKSKHSKYKKYKKLRCSYIKMSQLIDKLLSLNPKNLEHILILRKTDNIDISLLTMSDHLPRIARVSESLSFYAISFKPINNARKLWHILLQDRCHKGVMLSEGVISSWIAQLLSAVSFLHSNNIVHLDISPQSILITGGDRLILSGFDTSMIVNDHITYNVSGQLLNCCWQLPPQIRRRNDFNGFELKSFDAWSIGVLTFLLLTAKFPFFKDKHSKRIPESQYVINEQCISHSARDFISKLLSPSISNRLSVQNALHHPWIRNKGNDRIHLDGTIYSNMFMHHEQKLNIKYHILAQQTKQCLFIIDQKKLSKKIKILNKRMLKYQEKRSDHSDSSLFDIITSSDEDNTDNTDITDNQDISSSSHRSLSNTRSRNEMVLPKTYNINKKKKSKKKRKRNYSDSLRPNNKHFQVKRRNRANSQYTYSEYRAANAINKIDIEKLMDKETPLIDIQQRHHHFVRSNSNNIHQLTPTKPIYSRGSGHHTNVTTPNPTSSSTQNNNRLSPNQYLNEDRFRYNNKIKHQHKTSSGHLIAIERSVGPTSSPKHLPIINQYDIITADPLPQQAPKANTNHNVTNLPRRPSLPPKIIKLESPSQTINANISSSSSDNNAKNTKRSFQITRRELSPKQNVQKMALISRSDRKEEKESNEFVDYLSDLISREHPINEYDPLDLNDSTLKKAIQRASPSPSPPHVEHLKYPILSKENLSLHDQHLSAANLMALGSNDSSDKIKKDLSGSRSRLMLQNIVKNNVLRNSDSNVTSNSKAVVIAPSDADNDKSLSAMDILKAHKKHRHRNDNGELMEFLSMPQDIDATPRSSVMSLENILQERGLFKKENIKQSRDVVLRKSNENEENIDDIGMYAQLDPRLFINNPAIQIRDDHHIKKRKSVGRSNAFVFDTHSLTPTSNREDDYKEHEDIHYNIQKQIQQQETMTQSNVIHPRTPQTQQQQQPITSPLPITHAKHQHYSIGTSNIHKKRRTILNNNNSNDGDSNSEDPSTISALSPHIADTSNSSLYNYLNNNNNNNKSVNNDNRNNNIDLKSCEPNDDDGRTSTY